MNIKYLLYKYSIYIIILKIVILYFIVRSNFDLLLPIILLYSSIILILIGIKLYRYIYYFVHYREGKKLIKNKVKIPYTIYKTGPFKEDNIPTEIKNLFKKIEKENPKYKIVYFDDNKVRKFIQDNFNMEVLNAFDNLVPGAYKADLFRYCVLYKNGGIYSDLTQQFYVPLEKIIDHDYDNLVLVRDKSFFFEPGIQINFMAAKPKLKVYRDAINQIVKNVNNNFYGWSSLEVTGPILFRQILKKSNINYKLELEQGNYCTQDIKTKKKIYDMYIPNYRKLMKKKKNKRYGDLWNNGSIYVNKKFQHSDVMITEENFNYCRKYKKELLKNVAKLLDSLEIKYVISDGNLLEYYRGDIIVQDDDIDLRFHSKDFSKWEKYCKNLNSNVDKKYNLKYDDRIFDLKQQNINGIQIRLNTFHMKSPDKNFGDYPSCDLVRSDISSSFWNNVEYFFDNKLKKIRYMGVETYVPNEKFIIKFLKEEYGNNYHIPTLDNNIFGFDINSL